jgi:hypothetical protein
MEWVLVVLIAGAGGVAAKRWRDRRALRRAQQEELDGVRRLADEDVTLLGEQLQRLDRNVAGRALDDDARIAYQTALDSYESAQRAVPRIQSAQEISKVTDTLSAGRYALACVQARVAGRAVPEYRAPCFFNPQHGPSVSDVLWTPPGGGTRTVPACAQDAARVANHEKPDVRKVKVGSRTVPYWEAGTAYQPYAEGYFASAALMLWAFQPPGFSEGTSDFGGGFHDGGFQGGLDGGADGGGF